MKYLNMILTQPKNNSTNGVCKQTSYSTWQGSIVRKIRRNLWRVIMVLQVRFSMPLKNTVTLVQ